MENLNLYHVHKTATGIDLPKQLVVKCENGQNTDFISSQADVIHVVQQDGEIVDTFSLPGSIVNFEYLQIESVICVATENGSVFFQHIEGDQKLEEVGFCEDGIESMKFSPDQEMVCFVSK